MEKPKPKREVAIVWIGEITKQIGLNASADALSDFGDFGRLVPEANYVVLQVDARYDFQDVVDYIESYG